MPLLNDGTVQYGSRVITIATITYIAEHIEIKRPTVIIERRSEINAPNGQVQTDDFVTGSAVLQLATSSTTIPLPGATFSTTFDTVSGAETFFIAELGQPEEQGGAKKLNISFRKKYN